MTNNPTEQSRNLVSQRITFADEISVFHRFRHQSDSRRDVDFGIRRAEKIGDTVAIIVSSGPKAKNSMRETMLKRSH
jgi:hypothetical protein